MTEEEILKLRAETEAVTEDGELRKVRLPLEWKSADDLSIYFANQVAVNWAEDQFFLILGRLAPPPFLPSMPMPEKVFIHPLFKVAMSPTAMFAMTSALIDVALQYCRVNNIEPNSVLKSSNDARKFQIQSDSP